MKPILTQLQHSFARHSAGRRRRYSNASLREQAVKCLNHYTHKEISEAIGVTVNTLKAWQKALSHTRDSIVSEPTFLPMTLGSTHHAREVNQVPLVLQLILPSGITVKVESADLVSAAAFITTLSQEHNQCSI